MSFMIMIKEAVMEQQACIGSVVFDIRRAHKIG